MNMKYKEEKMATKTEMVKNEESKAENKTSKTKKIATYYLKLML